MQFDPALGQYFAGNSFHKANGDFRRTVVNPSGLKIVGEIVSPSAAEVEAVLDSAIDAQRGWARTDAKARALLLHRVADAIEGADPLPVAELMTREMGKPYPESVGEIANIPGLFRYMAEMARDDAGRIAGTTQTGSFQYCQYEPIGVSLHIVPFNFPLLLLSWTLAASLAAGNAVVIKPSELTSLCTLKFLEHFCVLPDGLVSCLIGGGNLGEALVRSDKTHVVAFTGSVPVGRKVALAAAETFKPCIIEAGGSDAMIVSDSVDPEFAAAAATTGCFHLGGQVCTSTERLYVHEAIHDAFIERFVARVRALRVGDGLQKSEIGPLATKQALNRVTDTITSAVARGAKIVTGGGFPDLEGWFLEPTILTDVAPEFLLEQGEVFGPLAPVCCIRSFEDGIAQANASPFGLGCSILTTRLSEIEYARTNVQAGMLWFNNPMIDNDALPFGGWKMSGVGRELGRDGLNAFRRSKMVILDSVPQIHDWWYPYPDDVFHPEAK